MMDYLQKAFASTSTVRRDVDEHFSDEGIQSSATMFRKASCMSTMA